MRVLALILLLLIIPTASAQDYVLSPGVIFEGTFTDPDDLTAEFVFSGQMGDIISINAGGLSELVIISPEGFELVRKSPDYAPDIQTGSVQLTAYGSYTVYVTGREIGDYSLMLAVRETPYLPGGTHITDEYFESTVQEMDFTFSGDAMDRVVLMVDSPFFDPVLTIYTPDDTLLATDDDSGGGTRAEIEIVLPQDGTYRAVVSSYYPGGSGSFYVAFFDTADDILRFGDTVDVTLDNTFWFWGRAGDEIAVYVDDPDADVRIEHPNMVNDLLAAPSPVQGAVFNTLDRVILPSSDLRNPYRIVINQHGETNSASARITLVRLGQNSLDGGGNLPFVLSPKQPSATFHFSGVDDAGVRLVVHQEENRYPLTPIAPFRVTVMQTINNRVAAAYTLDEVSDLYSVDLDVYIRTGFGQIDVVVELLDPTQTHHFWLSHERLYSIG